MTTFNLNYDHMATSIAQMSREEVKSQIMHFEGRFKLDFSEDYLDRLPVERLRHILLAAKLQQSQVN